MFNALFLTIAGTEHLSTILRLCVYGLVKNKVTMLRSLVHRGLHKQMTYSHDLHISVTNGAWETDDQLFIMSLVLTRPMFLFNTL